MALVKEKGLEWVGGRNTDIVRGGDLSVNCTHPLLTLWNTRARVSIARSIHLCCPKGNWSRMKI